LHVAATSAGTDTRPCDRYGPQTPRSNEPVELAPTSAADSDSPTERNRKRSPSYIEGFAIEAEPKMGCRWHAAARTRCSADLKGRVRTRQVREAMHPGSRTGPTAGHGACSERLGILSAGTGHRPRGQRPRPAARRRSIDPYRHDPLFGTLAHPGGRLRRVRRDPAPCPLHLLSPEPNGPGGRNPGARPRLRRNTLGRRRCSIVDADLQGSSRFLTASGAATARSWHGPRRRASSPSKPE